MDLKQARKYLGLPSFERNCRVINRRKAYRISGTIERLHYVCLLGKLKNLTEGNTFKRITIEYDGYCRGLYSSGHRVVRDLLDVHGLWNLNPPSICTWYDVKKCTFAFSEQGWENYGQIIYKALLELEGHQRGGDYKVNLVEVTGKVLYEDDWQVVVELNNFDYKIGHSGGVPVR